MSVVKEQMIKIISEQPEDADFNEILQELSFSAMVNRGVQDSQAKKVTSTSDLKEEIKTW